LPLNIVEPMQDLNKIFQATLEHLLAKRGEQAALAKRIGMPTTTLGDIKQGRRNASDEKKRAIAAELGFSGRHYENFLDIGRAVLAGRPVPEPPENYATQEDMPTAEYFHVPLDQSERLGAGGIHFLGQAKPEVETTFLIHGPTLGRQSGRNLRAFMVGGDSMEPLIGDGGIVVADLTKNRFENLREGAAYVIGWNEEGKVKYLRWAEKGKFLTVESENKFYKTVIKRPKEVTLIGQVIWSCRKHKI